MTNRYYTVECANKIKKKTLITKNNCHRLPAIYFAVLYVTYNKRCAIIL